MPRKIYATHHRHKYELGIKQQQRENTEVSNSSQFSPYNC